MVEVLPRPKIRTVRPVRSFAVRPLLKKDSQHLSCQCAIFATIMCGSQFWSALRVKQAKGFKSDSFAARQQSYI